MNLTKNLTSSLVKSLMSFKKTYGSLRRDPFKTPLFKNNLWSFSFLNIAIKMFMGLKHYQFTCKFNLNKRSSGMIRLFFNKIFFRILSFRIRKKKHNFDKLGLIISIKLSILNNRLTGILSVFGIPPVLVPIPGKIQLLMYAWCSALGY